MVRMPTGAYLLRQQDHRTLTYDVTRHAQRTHGGHRRCIVFRAGPVEWWVEFAFNPRFRVLFSPPVIRLVTVG